MLHCEWQQMNCVAMHQILRFYIFNVFISLFFCDSLPVFSLCRSMRSSYGCQTFSLSFLTVRPFSKDFCFHYSHYFLNSAWFSLFSFSLFLSLWSCLFPLNSVSNLALSTARQEGLILLWLGRNCENCRSPYTPACTLRRLLDWETFASDIDKCHTNAPTDIPYVPAFHKVFKTWNTSCT